MGTVFISHVIAAAADFGSVAPDVITGTRGPPAVCELRKAAMFVATEITPRSATQIGRAFGRRDHCTVVLARKQIIPRLKRDDVIAAAVAEIRRRARAKAGLDG